MLGSVSIGGTETYVNFGLATYLPPRYLLMLEEPGRQTVVECGLGTSKRFDWRNTIMHNTTMMVSSDGMVSRY